MKICMLAHRIVPPWDEGVKNNVIRLSKALAEFDHKVYILTSFDENFTCKEKGIEFRKIPLFNPKSSYPQKTFRFLVKCVPKVKRTVINLHCDVLHIHLHPSLLTFLGLTLLKGVNVPIIQTVHAQPRHILDDFKSRIQVRAGLSQVDIVTVSSAWLKNQLLKSGVPLEKIKRIPIGIFLDNYTTKRLTRKKLEEFGFSSDDFIILYGSGVGFYRGDTVMLNALRKVCRKIKNVKCIFNTRQRILEQDNDRVAFIKNKIREMGLQSNVKLIGTREDLTEIYAISHVLVMPLISPIAKLDYPLTIIEGFATGIPVIATNVGAIPEIVINGFNGFLLPPRDPDLLAQTILKLIKKPHLRVILGENAQRFARKKFDIYNTAKKIIEIYKHITCFKSRTIQSKVHKFF